MSTNGRKPAAGKPVFAFRDAARELPAKRALANPDEAWREVHGAFDDGAS